jgi:hypothetical protein
VFAVEKTNLVDYVTTNEEKILGRSRIASAENLLIFMV